MYMFTCYKKFEYSSRPLRVHLSGLFGNRRVRISYGRRATSVAAEFRRGLVEKDLPADPNAGRVVCADRGEEGEEGETDEACEGSVINATNVSVASLLFQAFL